ncbi:Baculoviral IAP repeat-containing protein 5 [Geodia barretti]|uniref:Baculoviral IAP repeat-containing protein 5 n=1 Tax=Geodia barretti TaxID=519541 RepID=A0AA35T1F8_GEOBA|nr:Baculoviral IAP repeat-containing protein 5 [Geodia barretti]
MAGSREPLPVELGALYTVEERLETFRVAHCSWPFDSGPCTPLKMAEAGFYFCGTDRAPDWVRCVVCHHDMEGWEATDDPRSEHKKHVPNCGFLKIKDPYKITVENVLDLEKKALETFIQKEKRELEKQMTAMVEGMKEQLAHAAAEAKTNAQNT